MKIGTKLPNTYKLRVKKDGFHSSSHYCKNLKISPLGLEEDLGELRAKIIIVIIIIIIIIINSRKT